MQGSSQGQAQWPVGFAHVSLQQHVVQFDVPVGDPHAVDVVHGHSQLLEQRPRLMFRQASALQVRCGPVKHQITGFTQNLDFNARNAIMSW